MDLSTTYLGLPLRTPLVPSASPLSEDVDSIRRLEDAGASAIVLYSLFAEQITHQRFELHHHLTEGTDSFAEALSYFPQAGDFRAGPEEYLTHIQRSKKAVDIPIIASLNGSSTGSWTRYASLMEEAGADALELNLYRVTTNLRSTATEVEADYLETLMAVKSRIKIPVSVKLSPYFSNLASMAGNFDSLGADGLVLFNRFYQPDIDLEQLEVRPNIILSTPQAMRLPMRWIAILFGHVRASLAATSGVHTAEDVLKLVMVGADVTMMCSALLRHGVERITEVERDLRTWMEEHEYESLAEMRGSMSQRRCPDPEAYERAQYMRALRSVRPQV